MQFENALERHKHLLDGGYYSFHDGKLIPVSNEGQNPDRPMWIDDSRMVILPDGRLEPVPK